MKKVCLMLLLGLLAVGFAVNAQATPVFKKHFDKSYVESSDNKDFVEAAKAAKCNVCHYGKSKKNRNDYGKALSKFLKKDDFKTSRVKAEPDKVEAEMKEGFEKAGKEKNADGKTFAELIKDGKLPGTEPAE